MCPSGNVKDFSAGCTVAAGAAGWAGILGAGAAVVAVVVGEGEALARAVSVDVAVALRLGAAFSAVAFSAGCGPQAERIRLKVRPATLTAP